MVQEHDEPILKHLIDVKVILLKADPMVSNTQTFFYHSVILDMNLIKLIMLMGEPENYRTNTLKVSFEPVDLV